MRILRIQNVTIQSKDWRAVKRRLFVMLASFHSVLIFLLLAALCWQDQLNPETYSSSKPVVARDSSKEKRPASCSIIPATFSAMDSQPMRQTSTLKDFQGHHINQNLKSASNASACI